MDKLEARPNLETVFCLNALHRSTAEDTRHDSTGAYYYASLLYNQYYEKFNIFV